MFWWQTKHSKRVRTIRCHWVDRKSIHGSDTTLCTIFSDISNKLARKWSQTRTQFFLKVRLKNFSARIRSRFCCCSSSCLTFWYRCKSLNGCILMYKRSNCNVSNVDSNMHTKDGYKTPRFPITCAPLKIKLPLSFLGFPTRCDSLLQRPALLLLFVFELGLLLKHLLLPLVLLFFQLPSL